MDKTHSIGSWGETIATEFLMNKGFTIIERNFRAARGEIDIICRDGETTVFVEVKTRKTAAYGLPESSITPAKQRQLYKVASAYIQQHPELETDFRFDVVVIDGTPRDYEIRYYPNAFFL